MKIPTFNEHLKEMLKDPIFKAGFDAWGDAIKEEIKPRDERIAQLEAKIAELEKQLKEDCEDDFSGLRIKCSDLTNYVEEMKSVVRCETELREQMEREKAAYRKLAIRHFYNGDDDFSAQKEKVSVYLDAEAAKVMAKGEKAE